MSLSRGLQDDDSLSIRKRVKQGHFTLDHPILIRLASFADPWALAAVKP